MAYLWRGKNGIGNENPGPPSCPHNFWEVIRAGRTGSVGRAWVWRARRGFESPVRQRIFLLESTFSADSLTVSVQPPYNICADVKNPKRWQQYIPLFGHTKMLHELVGMGRYRCSCGCCSLTRVRRPEFPARDTQVLKCSEFFFFFFFYET